MNWTSAACLRSVEGVEQQWEAILKSARNDSKLHVWRTQSDTHGRDPPKRSCQWIWPRTTWVWTKTGAPGTSPPEFRKDGKLKTVEYVTSCFSYTLAPKLASPATQSCRASNPVVSWSFFSQVKVVFILLHFISCLCFVTHTGFLVSHTWHLSSRPLHDTWSSWRPRNLCPSPLWPIISPCGPCRLSVLSPRWDLKQRHHGDIPYRRDIPGGHTTHFPTSRGR